MIRMPLIPSLALLLLGAIMMWQPPTSPPTLSSDVAPAPELIALPPSEELMALEIESLRAERGSILSGSVLAEEIAPVDFQVEQVPPASESIPVDPSDDTQRLVEQLRCLARELQADADRLEATANHRSLKK